MSLKLKSWRKVLKWAAWSLVAILFLVFLVRVATFENAYYSSKEGSERSVAATVDSNLSEDVPSAADVDAYSVPENQPRYLTVEKLGISKARVIPVGVDNLSRLSTPENIYDVGWYNASGLPGYGGTVLIDGHSGGPHAQGVFKNLSQLTPGDIIEIERGDGQIFRYRTVDNNAISLSDSDAYMTTAQTSPEPGQESVTLISCTGEWSDQRQTYLARQFVRAVLEE